MKKIILSVILSALVAAPVYAKAKSAKHPTKHTKHAASKSGKSAKHVVRKAPKVEKMPLNWREAAIQELGNGSLLVQDGQGRVILSHEADVPRMPASTIKVATAAAALKILGPNYHFPTDFYWTPDGTLTVKGYGDPTLTSEELVRIATQLKRAGVTKITKLRLDSSYFDPKIDIDVNGHNGRRNPFDADVGALIVNYNTAAVRISGRGAKRLIESADPATPLTPIVVERAAKLSRGVHRLDVCKNPHELLRFSGELIAAFLQQAGIPTSGDIVSGVAPGGLSPIYRHQSATSLTGIIIGMLEFSNNFTANQLFLATGAAATSSPATVAKSVKVVSDFLRQNVGWKNFTIAEGSGLSRQNMVTAADMMKLMHYFKPHQSLLPIKDRVFQAKTGTLADASCLAGYFPLPGGSDATFVIMINDPKTSYAHKFKVAKILYQGMTGQLAQ